MGQKPNSPWNFLTFFPKRLGICSPNFTRFLCTLDYKFLFNYLQLWRSYAILSATTIMCSKCPPSTETHAGWSHLIWHNFVTVGDNWIKICILANTWTFNRHVKFGLKIPNCLGKMAENASVRFGRWWTFFAGTGNWIKIRSLASIGTHNRHIKFVWKILNRFGKIATSHQRGDFLTHTSFSLEKPTPPQIVLSAKKVCLLLNAQHMILLKT